MSKLGYTIQELIEISDKSLYQKDGEVIDFADALWMVPPSYCDEPRLWYGSVYSSAQWVCFEPGQLLVIGPPVSRKQLGLKTGNICLYMYPNNGWSKRQYGEDSWVMDRWGREIIIASNRLCPIELCTPITKISERWMAREGWISTYDKTVLQTMVKKS